MAKRPWVTPKEVKNYTSYDEVKQRVKRKLEMDIFRAEQKVIAITHNDFSDDEKYPEIPQEIKTAVILIAEAFAKNTVESTRQRLTSETFDDYSYTAEASTVEISGLDIDDLLAPYILPVGKGNVFMRLRKL